MGGMVLPFASGNRETGGGGGGLGEGALAAAKEPCREKTTTGAKARAHSQGLSGPEGPLFHGRANIVHFFV
jgi:hypothetical protein